MTDEGVVATRIADCVVLAVPDDLAGERLRQLQDAAQRCVASASLRAMVFDMSALRYADATEFRAVAALADAMGILGVQPLMVGLNPGIIMHLVDAEADLGRMRAFLDLADALQFLGLTAPAGSA